VIYLKGLGGGPPELFGLSYQTRFKGFVATVMLASFFMFMAFFIGLPVIVIRPQKFALCFTLGSLLFMSSFALLRGPTAHIKGMLTLDRLPFTITYLTSMGATLWASLVARSYILAVLASSLQVLALGYYLLSFIPGGTAGKPRRVYDESNFIDDFPVPIPTGRCQSYGMFVTSCLRPSKLLFVPAPSDCDIGI
jgi:hypothetical protein